MDPTKPITGGELLEMYAERIESLEEALSVFYLNRMKIDGPVIEPKHLALAKEAARKLNALPERPLGA